MKKINILLIFLGLIFGGFAHADCASVRIGLHDDVNDAIHTYPASCVGVVHLKCSFLFKSRLPALMDQLNTDTPQTRVNLRKIVKAVSERKAELASIIEPSYQGQMNKIINGLNSYVRRCVR
jgi:hypothetical protein